MIGFKDSTTNNTIATPAYVDISDGTAAANVLSPGTTPPGVNGLLTAGTYWTPADFSPTGNAQSVIYDVGAFKSVAVTQTVAGTTATVAFQVSNDPNFTVSSPLLLQQVNTTSSASYANGSTQFTATSGQVSYTGSLLGFRYFRYLSSAYTATPTFKTCFSANAAPTTPVYNAFVTQTVSSSGGWSTFSNGALTNTPVTVKASSGALGVLTIHNPAAAATTYIQIWNLLIGAVTIGTTPPFDVIPVPAGQTITVNLLPGQTFSTAISIAATTTFNGSTAPTTAAVVSVKYA